MRSPDCDIQLVFRVDSINKRLNPMPFFIVEFSLAPSRLATHYNPTSRTDPLLAPDSGKITPSSDPNTIGGSTKKKMAVRSEGKIAGR
jgi:hypothetical protein